MRGGNDVMWHQWRRENINESDGDDEVTDD